MTTFDAKIATAIAHLTGTSQPMHDVIAAVGPCRLSPAWHRSPFESLVRAVSYQQLQKKAAEAVLGRFLALFAPKPFPSPSQVLAADDSVLRAVGFSRNKILAIRDIAAKAEAGIVPTREQADAVSDAELIGQLVVIRGVGRWTVEMLLIFTLGRLDVFPLDDFGVRKGLQIAFGLEAMPPKREMLAMTESWRPYRSVGSWYMWRLIERAARSRTPAAGPATAAETEAAQGEIVRREEAGGAGPRRPQSRVRG